MFLTQKTYPLILMVVAGIIGVYFWHFQAIAESDWTYIEHQMPMYERLFLAPVSSLPKPDIAKTVKVLVTAYSSTPEETDSTPFITASNTNVRSGIVANNILPFGTRIRLPEIFGDKIFEVEDRMHPRKSDYQVDIWFPSKEEAIRFGTKISVMEVIN